MLSANGLNVYILYFNVAATQKFSCRNLVGPSLSRSTLFCFGLAWSNQIAGKMYPEMDIRRTAHLKSDEFENSYSLLYILLKS